MSEQYLSVFLFINFEQALGFGHITWGLELEPGSYFYGSNDHLLRRPMWDFTALLRYSTVAPGGDTDYWSGSGDFEKMIEEMTTGPHIRYHAYKQLFLPASAAAPEEARMLAENLKNGGWSLWQNNCVHQTDRVVKTFGAAALVGSPHQSFTPIKYFHRAQAQACKLDLAAVKVRSCL